MMSTKHFYLFAKFVVFLQENC